MAETPALDHLTVACRNLDEGAAWVKAHLGILPDPGGRHPQIGTHNRLISLGCDNAPGEYLEIIAIDPDATAPGFPCWFGLDRFDGPPRLVGWVARTNGTPDQPGATPRDFRRDNLRWRFSLPDHGLRLLALKLSHPAPLPDLPVIDPRVTLCAGPTTIRARILSPKGETLL